jgi:hypothetical protein
MLPCVSGIDVRRGISSALDVGAALHEIGSGISSTLHVVDLLPQYIHWDLSSVISSNLSLVAVLLQRIRRELYMYYLFHTILSAV